MNIYIKKLKTNCKYLIYANYASPEVIHINPNKIEENAIVILRTKDNDYWIGYANKDDMLSKLEPKTLVMKPSNLGKIDNSTMFFSIEKGDYYGTYVASDFISNDKTLVTIYDFFE